jgi:hypothetical protein
VRASIAQARLVVFWRRAMALAVDQSIRVKTRSFRAIIIPYMTQHNPMLQRNLLYTGVTRGRNLVVLVGQPQLLGPRTAGKGPLSLGPTNLRIACGHDAMR